LIDLFIEHKKTEKTARHSKAGNEKEVKT